jgi:hypothetical protein
MSRRVSKLLLAVALAMSIPIATAAASDGGVCLDCQGGGGEALDEQLDIRELRALALEVGFRKPKLAAAVAMAESGGFVRARHRNRRPPSVDRGLFQINSHWHPEVSRACAYDARCNAEAAWRISEGGREWHQWTSYRDRSYRDFL